MTTSRLTLGRSEVLAFRRRAGALDERLPPGSAALRTAAWAGLQDSVPRAALHSIHARVAGTGPSAWEDPSLVQLWGPRFTVFVVAARDRGVFSLGTLPDDARARRRAEDLGARLRSLLGEGRMTYGEAGDALGVHPNSLRYAAATGTVLIRWEGARQPTIWAVPPPDLDAREARLELVRRYLHVCGPASALDFSRWSGVGPPGAAAAFATLRPELVPVTTPVGGEEWLLAADEALARAGPGPTAPARLLPSGDPYLLLHGDDRALVVADPRRRDELWTPRVWPGGLLVDGEVAGTWRRAGGAVTVTPWRRLTAAQREAVAAEAHTLPLPGAERVVLRWDE